MAVGPQCDGGTDLGRRPGSLAYQPAPLMTYSDDVWAIHQLYARFASARDRHLHEEWVSLFTEDGSLDIHSGSHKGHDSLMAFSLGVERATSAASAKHFVSNIDVAINGDEADGTAYFQYFRTVDGRPVLAGMGTYTDRFRRVGAEWKIVQRIGRTETDRSLMDL